MVYFLVVIVVIYMTATRNKLDIFMSQNYDDVISEADEAFDNKRFDEALLLYERAISLDGSHPDPYFCVAKIYENGLGSKGSDFKKALFSYSRLMELGDTLGEGSLGVARVLYKNDDACKRDLVIENCLRSIEVRNSGWAHMLLGATYGNWFNDLDKANLHFLIAYRKGIPWALRLYAISLFRQRKYLRSLFYHVKTTFIGPLFFIRNRGRVPSPFG